MAEHYNRSMEFEDSPRLYGAIVEGTGFEEGFGSSSGDCKALLSVQWSGQPFSVSLYASLAVLLVTMGLDWCVWRRILTKVAERGNPFWRHT
jgi:hypothetical protein